MGKVLNIVFNILIERFAISEDEHQIHQLLVGVRSIEAMQPVGKPANRKRLSAAGGVVDQVLSPDFPAHHEMRYCIISNPPHHAALVVARKDREGWALWPILFCLALWHVDKKERQSFQ